MNQVKIGMKDYRSSGSSRKDKSIGPNGTDEPYAKVPIRLIRSEKLTGADKTVFNAIVSCGYETKKNYPSYSALQKWTGFGRTTIARSLRKLEYLGIVKRHRDGNSTHYETYWSV